jgi:hypothetical protein
MATITVQGDQFSSASEALQFVDSDGRGTVISIGGTYIVVAEAEAERLETEGYHFAVLSEMLFPSGGSTIVAVPVN